jgi:hypothetical protein
VPDFPAALGAYRDAVAAAKASADPPFDPPADFRQGEVGWRRRECWRTPDRFPTVRAGWEWLAEMVGRAHDGVPPVSEAEFGELAAWFRANDARLYQLSRPSELLELGDGRRTWCSKVRYELARSPRSEGAGRAAEDVRRLRARYGESG